MSPAKRLRRVLRRRKSWVVLHGDSLALLQRLPRCSIDSVVTDPPAGIGFMGKAWDSFNKSQAQSAREHFVAWLTQIMQECYRVLKPGGHALVWALPRTSHWTATAIEDADFECRDVLVHIFGSGFPKSLDVGKAIDKAAGRKRKVIAPPPYRRGKPLQKYHAGRKVSWDCDTQPITAPATEAARQWSGWGTALKPASEHWILARKPLVGTVAANVLQHGTGALNIDGCRVGNDTIVQRQKDMTAYHGGKLGAGTSTHMTGVTTTTQGRWPANLVLSHTADCKLTRREQWRCGPGCPIQGLNAQSGALHARGNHGAALGGGGLFGHGRCLNNFGAGDAGGASRFFYTAKSSKSERSAGCSDLYWRLDRPEPVQVTKRKYRQLQTRNKSVAVGNIHPTVKSLKLMAYLCRLITPPGGVVLDCFNGSGSTGVAALREGFRYIGFEGCRPYVLIARKRLTHQAAAKPVEREPALFRSKS